MKIAQITAYRISYGSPLQAYATQKAFLKEGISLELFRYEPAGKTNLKRRMKKILRFPSVIINKLNELLFDLIKPAYRNGKKNRDKLFEDFLEKNANVSKIIKTETERDKEIRKYGAVLSGSDQTWNPINYGERYFTCEFVPETITLISYASSFGTSTIPKWQYRGTMNYINRFTSISLREKSGHDIVKSMSGKEYPVVLDPTLLLDRTEWEKICVKKTIKYNYIFSYLISSNKKFRELVSKFAKNINHKIIAVPHVLKYVVSDEKYCDESRFGASPDEWISFIRDAKFVFTDSYHAVIFSIIFKKRFIVMKRFRDDDVASANTRIYEILSKLGLEDRIWIGGNLKEIAERDIDYDAVYKKLRVHKDVSYEYIKSLYIKLKCTNI